MTELNPTELYKEFGKEVTAAIETAAAAGYQLKQADDITVGALAKFERRYFVDGKPPTGKYNVMVGYINAASMAGFFEDGNAPKPKDVDNMTGANAAVLFKAIDLVMIRCGQIDPN